MAAQVISVSRVSWLTRRTGQSPSGVAFAVFQEDAVAEVGGADGEVGPGEVVAEHDAGAVIFLLQIPGRGDAQLNDQARMTNQ